MIVCAGRQQEINLFEKEKLSVSSSAVENRTKVTSRLRSTGHEIGFLVLVIKQRSRCRFMESISYNQPPIFVLAVFLLPRQSRPRLLQDSNTTNENRRVRITEIFNTFFIN